jgi:uncharacterized protein (TIGR02246 family)
MKSVPIRLAAVLLFPLSTFFLDGAARGQTAADEAAVRTIPQAFAAAWAKHDGQQLAAIMAEDVDFVDVAGDWLQGRADFALYHSRLLSARFRDSTLTPLEISVRFLHPDLAVLHWSWRVEGDRNFDQTPRNPRYGLFTMIVVRTGRQWLVAVAQNTNRIAPPNPDPEMEGIKLGILFPDDQH